MQAANILSALVPGLAPQGAAAPAGGQALGGLEGLFGAMVEGEIAGQAEEDASASALTDALASAVGAAMQAAQPLAQQPAAPGGEAVSDASATDTLGGKAAQPATPFLISAAVQAADQSPALFDPSPLPPTDKPSPAAPMGTVPQGPTFALADTARAAQPGASAGPQPSQPSAEPAPSLPTRPLEAAGPGAPEPAGAVRTEASNTTPDPQQPVQIAAATPAAMPNLAPAASSPIAASEPPVAQPAAAEAAPAQAPAAASAGKPAANRAAPGMAGPKSRVAAPQGSGPEPTLAEAETPRSTAVGALTEAAVKAVETAERDDAPAETDLKGPAPAEATLAAAPSAPVQAQPAETPKVTTHTVAHLAAQVVHKAEGGKATRFDVALNPEGLGQVEVRIEIGARGDVVAQMNFENPEAASQMRARAGELQAALSQAGFDADKTSLSFNSGGPSQDGLWRQGDQNQGGGRPAWTGRAFSQIADEADAASAPAWSRGASDAGVDVRI